MKNTIIVLMSAVLIPTVCAVAQDGKHKPTQTEQYGVALTRIVRDMARDPDSFRVSRVRVVDSMNVCIVGRARNSFGGYVSLKAVVIAKGKFKGVHFIDDQDSESFWGIWCENEIDAATGTDNEDVTDAVKGALKADREKD